MIHIKSLNKRVGRKEPNKYVLGVLIVGLIFLGLWVMQSEGFCYERHNGLYCYKGLSIQLVAWSILIVSLSCIVGLIELVTQRTLVFLEANASLVVFCGAIIVFFVAMFVGGKVNA